MNRKLKLWLHTFPTAFIFQISSIEIEGHMGFIKFFIIIYYFCEQSYILKICSVEIEGGIEYINLILF